jgi:hypothetical protein
VTAVLTYTIMLPLIMVAMPKSGMAWHNRQPADANVLGGINWYYTYGLHPYPNEDAQFIPMLWCNQWPAYDYIGGYNYLQEAVKLYPPDYAGWMLILNEPDLPGSDRDGGQCGMTPIQAAYFYQAAVTLWPNAQFIGPAVSHRDYQAGWPWLRQWYKEVARLDLPTPARSAIHTYLGEPPAAILDSYHMVMSPYNAPGMVWVTEFGSPDPVQTARMIDVWKARPDVERYAYFTTRGGGGTDLFVDIPGYSLTPNGYAWRAAHK